MTWGFSDLEQPKNTSKSAPAIFERITDSFMAISDKGIVLYANRNVCKILKTKAESLVKHNLWDTFSYLRETRLYKLCQNSLSEHCAVRVQESLPPYDKWYDIRIYPCRFGLEVYLSDVTDRILAEKVLVECERNRDLLIENLPGVAYRRSPESDCMMHFLSEGCRELTGYRPESLLYSRKLRFIDIVAPEFRANYHRKWAEAMKKNSIFDEKYQLIRAGGEYIWVRERGKAVRNSKGQVEAVEGLLFNIDDQIKSQSEVQYLRSHDPLSGIYNRQHFMLEAKRLDVPEQMPLSIIFGDINGLKLINNAVGHENGDRMIVEAARLIKGQCRENDVPCRFGGGQFCILMPRTNDTASEALIQDVIDACNCHNQLARNEMGCINLSLGHATKDMYDISIDSVIQLAEENMYKRKLLDRKSMHSSLLSSIQSTLLARSQETEEHAERLIKLTRILGMKLNLAQIDLNELELLAALHDIGKVGINDRILNKPDRLTDDEWIEMKKHSEIGYRIAMSSPELMPIADYILAHHERWDGTGYPNALTGEKIPFMSRVLSVVDAYDAMTQDRTYRKAMPKEYALLEIMNNSGKQFDPAISEAFLDFMRSEDCI